MTFGNYDAGQSRPISNPLFNGGVRSNGTQKAGFNFDFGFNKVGKADEDFTIGSEMGFERTGSPKANTATETFKSGYTLIDETVGGDSALRDRAVDELLNPYITAESRKYGSYTITATMNDVLGICENLG